MADRKQAQHLATQKRAQGGATGQLLGDQRARAMVGNAGMGALMDQGRADRNLMLGHIGSRLTAMQDVQHQEVGLTQRGAVYDWWRHVARGPEGALAPDPTRWHQAAREYDVAAAALCRGDLDRGRQLLERAMDTEARALSRLTDLVNLPYTDGTESLSPLNEVTSGGLVDPIDKPNEIGVAQEILSVTTETPMTPRLQAPVPWWALEEEEEEDQEDDDDANDGD